MKFRFLHGSHSAETFFLNRIEKCAVERSNSKQQKEEEEDFKGKTQSLLCVDL